MIRPPYHKLSGALKYTAGRGKLLPVFYCICKQALPPQADNFRILFFLCLQTFHRLRTIRLYYI
ncbi:hypothetical protein DPQ25_04285 [Hydrogeniiclostridium mannosilyticum]|uniref:Uncharacterized protein n=1 Tax=Hydrogeniiclostridium mannosilyticum TaxID=2764322 RepID=A0A328UFU1_9FIRM|nr:hypothetical protein DPQ25_04285 [Hydrogeniiclostridium mannosilyticum]